MFLQITKFVDLNNNGDEIDKSYGFRICDSYKSLLGDYLKEKIGQGGITPPCI